MNEELENARKNIQALARVAQNIGSQVKPEHQRFLNVIIQEVFLNNIGKYMNSVRNLKWIRMHLWKAIILGNMRLFRS